MFVARKSYSIQTSTLYMAAVHREKMFVAAAGEEPEDADLLLLMSKTQQIEKEVCYIGCRAFISLKALFVGRQEIACVPVYFLELEITCTIFWLLSTVLAQQTAKKLTP